MSEISIDVTCELDDYVAFNLFTMNKYYKWNFMILLMRVLCVLLLVVGIIVSEFHIFIYLGLFLLIYSLVHYPIMKRSIRKVYLQSPIMGQKSILTINKERVIEVADTNTSNIPWEQIVQIGENKKHIFIYISKAQAYIINKDKLSDDELSIIRSLIPINIKRI